MRKHILLALAGAACLASGAASSQSDSDANPFWTGCVIARQFEASGRAIAINRVCSVPDHTFSVFEPYQRLARPPIVDAVGSTTLDKANLRFTGFRSRFAQGDSRKARLWLLERSPLNNLAKYTYDLDLTVDQEAIVAMPSGIFIGLRMDPSNAPTSFGASLSMSTGKR